MRPIKFRQWLGDRFEYWGIKLDDSNFIGPCSGGSMNAGNTPHHQFTGIFDMTGQEIYEGDIVSARYELSEADNYEVRFHDGRFSLCVPWEEIGINYFLSTEMLVIGNICETPEFCEDFPG